MAIKFKEGLVIRYDFLWKHESERGQIEGTKDRPCSVVLTMEGKDNHKKILVCPITHTPPEKNKTFVKIPPKVAKHIGLDEQQSWIKTDQVNSFLWDGLHIPYGVSRASRQKWEYGELPYQIAKEVFEQVRSNIKTNNLENIKRDEE